MTGEEVYRLIKKLLERGNSCEEIVEFLMHALSQEYGDEESKAD